MDDTTSAPVRLEEPQQAGSANKIVEGSYRPLEGTGKFIFNAPLRYTLDCGSFSNSTGIRAILQRATLENKDFYGLKRWEIGELASKIGQLYYHYYLRTSETNYLNESFIFYEAIRERNYFKDVLEAKHAPLMVKKLRYYARFIVVCLLLNKSEMIQKLMEQLTVLVEDYNAAFKPADYPEWNVVLSEISTFLEAERKLSPVDLEGSPLGVQARLKIDHTPKADKDGQPRLKLQEAILVGNYLNQIKFSELTLDMYRVLQSLEREAAAPVPSKPVDPQTSMGMNSIEKEEDPANSKRTNPRKYLLYRPTFAQLMLYVSTCFKDIGENSALMLYISADGSKRLTSTESNEYNGGVATAVNYNNSRKAPEKIDADQNALTHTFHPQDLVPFTRKALFVIIDSTNSVAFNNLPKIFNQPFACLMSPVAYPTTIKDTTQIGSLFSLFLHCPVKAFAFISDLTQMNSTVWEQVIADIEQIEKLILQLLEKDPSLDKSYARFIQDDFLGNFCARFVFMSVLVGLHQGFTEQKHRPVANPEFPKTVLENADLVAKIQDLIKKSGVEKAYTLTAAAVEEPAAQ